MNTKDADKLLATVESLESQLAEVKKQLKESNEIKDTRTMKVGEYVTVVRFDGHSPRWSLGSTYKIKTIDPHCWNAEQDDMKSVNGYGHGATVISLRYATTEEINNYNIVSVKDLKLGDYFVPLERICCSFRDGQTYKVVSLGDEYVDAEFDEQGSTTNGLRKTILDKVRYATQEEITAYDKKHPKKREFKAGDWVWFPKSNCTALLVEGSREYTYEAHVSSEHATHKDSRLATEEEILLALEKEARKRYTDGCNVDRTPIAEPGDFRCEGDGVVLFFDSDNDTDYSPNKKYVRFASLCVYNMKTNTWAPVVKSKPKTLFGYEVGRAATASQNNIKIGCQTLSKSSLQEICDAAQKDGATTISLGDKKEDIANILLAIK